MPDPLERPCLCSPGSRLDLCPRHSYTLPLPGETRDGIEVVDPETREVIRFVACSYGGSQRERVMLGMLHNLNERYFIRDTRHANE